MACVIGGGNSMEVEAGGNEDVDKDVCKSDADEELLLPLVNLLIGWKRATEVLWRTLCTS